MRKMFMIIIAISLVVIIAQQGARADSCFSTCDTFATSVLTDRIEIKNINNLSYSSAAWFCSLDFEEKYSASSTGIDIVLPTDAGPLPLGFKAGNTDAWQKRTTFCANNDKRLTLDQAIQLVRSAGKENKDGYAAWARCTEACSGSHSEVQGRLVPTGDWVSVTINRSVINPNDDFAIVEYSEKCLKCETHVLKKWGAKNTPSSVQFPCGWDKDSENGIFSIVTSRGAWSGDVCRKVNRNAGTLRVVTTRTVYDWHDSGEKCSALYTSGNNHNKKCDHAPCQDKWQASIGGTSVSAEGGRLVAPRCECVAGKDQACAFSSILTCGPSESARMEMQVKTWSHPTTWRICGMKQILVPRQVQESHEYSLTYGLNVAFEAVTGASAITVSHIDKGSFGLDLGQSGQGMTFVSKAQNLYTYKVDDPCLMR